MADERFRRKGGALAVALSVLIASVVVVVLMKPPSGAPTATGTRPSTPLRAVDAHASGGSLVPSRTVAVASTAP